MEIPTLHEVLDRDQEATREREWKREARLLAETVAEYGQTLEARGVPEKEARKLTRKFQNDLTWLKAEQMPGDDLFSGAESDG